MVLFKDLSGVAFDLGGGRGALGEVCPVVEVVVGVDGVEAVGTACFAGYSDHSYISAGGDLMVL